MPFQKGNKLGAKGRPKGSKNKATDVNKFQLQQVLYNIEEFINDFNSLSPDKKMDIRMKGMSFFYSIGGYHFPCDPIGFCICAKTFI